MVQEYERAVVFRLGRLRSGGAKGPGLFFVMPCVDSYKKVDLRTVSFDVPPQEVNSFNLLVISYMKMTKSNIVNLIFQCMVKIQNLARYRFLISTTTLKKRLTMQFLLPPIIHTYIHS